MSRHKPTKEELKRWRDKGLSYTDMKDLCGYSKSMLSKLFKEFQLEPASVGRKKGSKMSGEQKKKLSEIATDLRNKNG